MEDNRFYVYAFLDTRKSKSEYYYECNNGEKYGPFEYPPFYIGKGHAHRMSSHLTPSILKRDKHLPKTKTIKKILNETGKFPDYIKIKDNISEEESFKLEINLIATIGRRDLKLGPLVNLTNGGEGPSGYIYTPEELEFKRIQNSGIGNPMWGKFGENNPRYGLKHTDKSKSKIKQNHHDCSGKNNSRSLQFCFIDPLHNEHIVHGEFEKFCNLNSLPWSIMYRISTNKRKDKFYNNWTVYRM